MELIAVILNGKTSAQRFQDAQTLLNYGFSAYALKTIVPEEPLPPVKVTLGSQATVQPVPGPENKLLLEKAKAGTLSQSVTLEPAVQAPFGNADHHRRGGNGGGTAPAGGRRSSTDHLSPNAATGAADRLSG